MIDKETIVIGLLGIIVVELMLILSELSFHNEEGMEIKSCIEDIQHNSWYLSQGDELNRDPERCNKKNYEEEEECDL